MRESTYAERPRSLSVYVRAGLSLALGTLAILVLAGVVSVASPSLAPAGSRGPGDLDASFGAGGVVTTAIVPGNDSATAVAIQEDGKIVVAGYASDYAGGDDIAVVRYTASGTLDTAFGASGVVTTPIGVGRARARAVAIQQDGRIVVAGYAWGGSEDDMALVRYTSSGTLDTTFGASGVVTTPIGAGRDRARGVAIQEDGKIVAVGHAYNDGDADIAVVRYTVSGTLDTTFGTGGIVTTSIGPGDDAAFSVAIQEDGKIVAAGGAWGGSDNDLVVVRYTLSGNPDATFGNTGVVTTPIGPGDDTAFGVAIQEDGKIVAVGDADSGSDNDFVVVRYTLSGDPDATFGNTGVVTTPIGPGSDHAAGVAIQKDGRIVVAGTAFSTDSDIAVVRYTVSGMLDTAFGTGGVVTTSIGSSHDQAYGVAIQEDGKIVAAGGSFGGSATDVAVVRYDAEWHTYLPLVLRSY